MIWAQGWFWADFLAWWISEPGRLAEQRRLARRFASMMRCLAAAISAAGLSFEEATAGLAPFTAIYAASMARPAGPPWQSRPGPGG